LGWNLEGASSWAHSCKIKELASNLRAMGKIQKKTQEKIKPKTLSGREISICGLRQGERSTASRTSVVLPYSRSQVSQQENHGRYGMGAKANKGG
jgi:hypothetical protein